MKKLLTLLIVILSFQNLYSQKFTEKKIAEFPGLKSLDIYSLKADPLTGACIYGDYDTTTTKYTVYTNKGKTEPFNYFMTWQTLFDKDGNSYYIAYNNLTDTTFTYFLMKNNEKLANFDYINEMWVERDGIIYFACKENNKHLIVSYNIKDGKLTRGKPYDEIIPCYVKPSVGGEGEPYGELAFTSDGKIYFIAAAGNEKFLVIGDVEQKHYSDIDLYTFTQDKYGAFAYVARDAGKFYNDSGNTFVVHGENEYKKYNYIYGPIIFNSDNMPVYTATPSNESSYNQKLVIGNIEGKTYDGGVYDYKFTPSGKLAYIASTIKNIDKGTYESFVVVDGKEGKKYSNIYSLSFPSGDEPLYAAFKKNNECFIVNGNKTNEYSYEGVIELSPAASGKIICLGVNYGNYEKKIPDKYWVNIGDEELGPYNGLSMSDYTTGEYILTDNSGNYAFIAQKVKNINKYIYRYIVVTNKDTYDEHEYIESLYLYKGKPVYVATDNYNEKTGKSEYTVYYGDKPAGVVYDGIYEFKFDANTGTATFTTSKINSFYVVEMKF
ncbi:MAG: hypothetical protein EHM58_10515 [Ignavibacteriae bacterium]|nr:MAG: hypothetical protein EHM58_10515 [Ignavibacteriota bacterium]